MNNSQVEFVLTLTDQATQKWNSFKQNVESGSKSLMSTLSNLRNAFLALGAMEFLRESVKDFAAAEMAAARLSLALKNSGVVSKEVNENMLAYAETMQRTTAFSHEQVTQVQSMLIAMTGLTGNGLKPLTQATLDLAAGLGIDAEHAALMISKAMEGSNALGRYGINVKLAGSEMDRMKIIVDAIREKFGGFAQNELTTTEGKMKQLANTFSGVKEAIGGLIAENLSSALPAIVNAINYVVSFAKAAVNTIKYVNAMATTEILAMAIAAAHAVGLNAEWMEKKLVDTITVMTTSKKLMDEGWSEVFGTASAKAEDFGKTMTRSVTASVKTVAVSMEKFKDTTIDTMRGMYVKLTDSNDWWSNQIRESLRETMKDAERAAQFQGEIIRGVLSSLQAGFAAAFSGEEAGVKVLLKSILNSIITAVEGMMIAAQAASAAFSILSFGGSLLADLPQLVAGFAFLETARGIVNSFEHGTPSGGFMVPGGFPHDSYPILVSSGERVDVTPAGKGGPGGMTINFNGDTISPQFVVSAIKSALRETGLTADKLLVNNRGTVSIAR